MNELYDSIKCLCDSPQRFRILDTLDSAQMDLRSLMTELKSPRTTLQRNLSILEQRGWIEDTCTGYTTTAAGSLILNEVMVMDETIETINSVTPFLAAIDAPAALDIDQLTDARTTVPEPTQPNAPMKHLLDIFEKADRIRGCLPVVSWLLVERSHHVDDDITPEHEYVVSRAALDALRKQDAAERGTISEVIQPALIDIYVYEDVLPYGLFIARDRLALAAYNEIGRIQALVESASETTIEWGERVYDHYKQQSKQLYETDST